MIMQMTLYCTLRHRSVYMYGDSAARDGVPTCSPLEIHIQNMTWWYGVEFIGMLLVQWRKSMEISIESLFLRLPSFTTTFFFITRLLKSWLCKWRCTVRLGTEFTFSSLNLAVISRYYWVILSCGLWSRDLILSSAVYISKIKYKQNSKMG
jgi:hypothetical protein